MIKISRFFFGFLFLFSLGLLVIIWQGAIPFYESLFLDDSIYPGIGRDSKVFFKNGKYQILRGPKYYYLYDFSKNQKILATNLIDYDWSYFEKEVYLIGHDSKERMVNIFYVFIPESGEIQSFCDWKMIPEKFRNQFKNLELEVKNGSRFNFRLHQVYRQ
ncbi:MAG: hypothetical protein HQM08_30845 [Candidatus Riflebacteria bacterium]|nr:hypothetical protein [Candidatus Riflebacteria bacterium]